MKSTLDQEALRYHSEGRPGKIGIQPTKPSHTQHDLSLAYSPGVAAPARAIAADAADLDALNAVATDGRTVADKVTEKSGQTGEKVELTYYAKIEAPMCVTYIHTNHKLGTLIGFNKEIAMETAKDVAMQAAAMAPISISREDADPAVIEHERAIGREQARLDGKPEAMLDKIAEGKVNKFLTENTLLNQPLVKNNKLSVGAYIKQVDAEATVVAYKRFSLND